MAESKSAVKKGGGGSLVIRVRTQLGTWRLQDVHPSDSFGSLRSRLETEHSTDLNGRPFTADPGGQTRFSDTETVGDANLTHGAIIYAMVDETKTGVHENAKAGRRITKEGNIVAQEYVSVANREGFRPGMMPLRNMKMHWTLDEFIALDSQFEYKMKKELNDNRVCKTVKIDSAAANDFTSYMDSFDYQRMRVGYLYGQFVEGNEVRVEFIYEPPQDATDVSFTLLDDPRAETVDAIASMLGMRKVGWIFAHPTREDGFFFSGAEVIEAAEQQLVAAGGVEDTCFVTIKATRNASSELSVEGYQITKQGMEMAAEGVLQVSPNLGCCAIHPTFTAIVEGKPTKEVDTSFFLLNVGIEQFTSELLLNDFPKANREGVIANTEDLKRQISRDGRQGWTMQSLVADFQLLLFLSNFLDVNSDLPRICQSILNRDIPLDEGHQLLIRQYAGMD